MTSSTSGKGTRSAGEDSQPMAPSGGNSGECSKQQQAQLLTKQEERGLARSVVSSFYQRVLNHLNSEEDTQSKFRSCNEFTI